jgi:hypothetical protein
LEVITTSANGASELLGDSADVVPPGDVAALRSALRGVHRLSLDERWERRERLHGRQALTDWGAYGAAVLDVIGQERDGRRS